MCTLKEINVWLSKLDRIYRKLDQCFKITEELIWENKNLTTIINIQEERLENIERDYHT